MQIFAHLSRVSGNAKTGPIPVSTTSANTCPASCPLNKESGGKGCYASGGPSAIHWRKVGISVANGGRGKPWEEFCDDVKALPRGQLWRMNQAGDLPGENDTIHTELLRQLVQANKGKKGFTYTHYPVADTENGTHAINASAIYNANHSGFTVNLSANNIKQAVDYMALDIAPVVTLLPMDAPNVQTVTDKAGNALKVVACPAEKSDKVTCANCALCADSNRDYVIGFRAHGVSKRAVEIIAKG